jgi:hypothetical protein
MTIGTRERPYKTYASFALILLAAVALTHSCGHHALRPFSTVYGPTSKTECVRFVNKGGKCPWCGHCSWTDNPPKCVVDDVIDPTTCECYDGQGEKCDLNTQGWCSGDACGQKWCAATDPFSAKFGACK